jgi:uncharacterized integral membrane protein
MKLSWVLPILLLVFVAVFSVQNAEPITVRFLAWQATLSAALVIQLAALLGGLVGLTAGAWSRRARRQGEPAGSPTTPQPTMTGENGSMSRPGVTEVSGSGPRTDPSPGGQ